MSDYDGKWALSDHWETWNFEREDVFETKEEAIAAAPAFCEKHGITTCHVGQARAVDYQNVIGVGGIENLIENAHCHDDLAGADYEVIELSQEQMEALADVVHAWLRENLGPMTYHVVDDIEEVRAPAQEAEEAGR